MLVKYPSSMSLSPSCFSFLLLSPPPPLPHAATGSKAGLSASSKSPSLGATGPPRGYQRCTGGFSNSGHLRWGEHYGGPGWAQQRRRRGVSSAKGGSGSGATEGVSRQEGSGLGLAAGAARQGVGQTALRALPEQGPPSLGALVRKGLRLGPQGVAPLRVSAPSQGPAAPLEQALPVAEDLPRAHRGKQGGYPGHRGAWRGLSGRIRGRLYVCGPDVVCARRRRHGVALQCAVPRCRGLGQGAALRCTPALRGVQPGQGKRGRAGARRGCCTPTWQWRGRASTSAGGSAGGLLGTATGGAFGGSAMGGGLGGSAMGLAGRGRLGDGAEAPRAKPAAKRTSRDRDGDGEGDEGSGDEEEEGVGGGGGGGGGGGERGG